MARPREYVEEGNQQQAEAFYLQSISVLEKLNDFTAQWNLETSLDQLGELYRKEHRYSDSEKVLLRAFAAWEKQASAPPMTGPGTCDPLQTLERLYRDQGRLPEIEPFYERVVRLQERAKEQDVWDTTITLTGLANVYSEEGKHEATLPLFQRMLAVEEAKWGRDDPRIAETLESEAAELEELNRMDEAARLRVRAARLRAQSAAQEKSSPQD